MGQFTEIKKEDIGFKFASGILSSDATAIDWFAEKLGLSPNQLPADIWMEEVPEAENYSTALTIAASTDYPQITRHATVTLKKVANVNETLWMAVDSSGNRMRNFINPSNHQLTNPTNPNDKGSASIGYQIKLYQVNSSTNNTSTQINLTNGTWMFYYKEGVLACSEIETPALMGWSTGSNNDTLHAELFQYTGVNLLPSNPPQHGQVLAYNNPGGSTDPSFTWVDNSGGSGSGSGVVTDNDYGDITVDSNGALWTIDTGAVTYGKIQDVTAGERMLGRKASTAGPIEEFSATEVRSFVGIPETANSDGHYADLTPDWVPSVDPGYLTSAQTEVNNLDVNSGGAVTWGNVIVPSLNINGHYQHIATIGGSGGSVTSVIDFDKNAKGVWLAANGSQTDLSGNENHGPQHIVSSASATAYLDANQNMWNTSTSANLGESGAGKASWANLYLEKGGDVEWYGGSAYIRHDDSLQSDNSLVDDLDIRARGSINLLIGDHNNNTVTSLNVSDHSGTQLLRIAEDSSTYTFFDGNPLTSQSGGTGYGSYSTGDILYCEFGNGNNLAKLPVGAIGDILYVGENSDGNPVPVWSNAGAFYNWTLQDEGGDSKTIGNGKHVMLDTDTNLYTNWTYTSDTENPAGSADFPFKIEIGLNGTIDVTNSGTASNVSGVVAIANGGTGATNAADARTNLGVDAAGTDNSTPVTLTNDGSFFSEAIDYVQLNAATQVLNLSKVDLFYDVKSILFGKNGGTGWGSQTNYDAGQGIGVGDILFGASTNGQEDIIWGGNKQDWDKLSIGNENDILQVSSSGIPTWTALSTVVQNTNIANGPVLGGMGVSGLQMQGSKVLNFTQNRTLTFMQPAENDSSFNVQIKSIFSGDVESSSVFDFTGASGDFKIHDPNSDNFASLFVDSFTANNVFSFPDKGGTFALTNDLTNFVSDGDTNVDISITGNAGGIDGTLPLGQGGTGSTSWSANNLVHVNSSGDALTHTDGVTIEGGTLVMKRLQNQATGGWYSNPMFFQDFSGANLALVSSPTNNGATVILPNSSGTLALTTNTVAGASEVDTTQVIPVQDINYPLIIAGVQTPFNGLNPVQATSKITFNPSLRRLRGLSHLQFDNSDDTVAGSSLRFHKQRSGVSAALLDGDEIGKISFSGVNSNSTSASFAEILVSADDVSNGSEQGIIDFKVATNGVGNPLYSALKISSLSSPGETRIDIGGSNSSQTHIDGNLYLTQVLDIFGGHFTTGGATINTVHKSGEFANNDTSLMTSAAIDDHILSKNYMDGFVLQDSNDVGKTIIEDSYIKVTSSIGSSGTSWSGSGTSGDPWVLDIKHPFNTVSAGDGIDLTTNIYSVDTKANGGLVFESTKLAVDLGASDITGTLGVTDGGTGLNSLTANKLLKVNSSGDGFDFIDEPTGGGSGGSVSNQADHCLVTSTGSGNNLEAESNLTYNSSLNLLELEAGFGGMPSFNIVCDNDGNNGGKMNMVLETQSVAVNDFIGAVGFQTRTATFTGIQTWASYSGEPTSVTTDNEHGMLELRVMRSDGTGPGDTGAGLIIQGTNTNNEIDVTLGDGAGSTTTVSGDLSITSGLILDSVDVTTIQTSGESFSDNDTSLMTSAAIDDRIAAAGGGATVNNEANNSLVTSTGSGGGLDAEANLTFDASKLQIGDTTDSRAYITRRRPADGNNGGALVVAGGDSKGTDKIGGNVELIAGLGSGNQPSGKISFYTHAANSSNAGTNNAGTVVEVAKITDRGDLELVTTGNFRGGNMGTIYKDAIYLTPTDFMHASSNKVAEVNDEGGSITAGAASVKYHAIVQVPSGYKATHVHVYGSASSNTERVYYYQSTVSGSGYSTLMGTNTFGYVNTQTTLDTPFTGNPGRYMIVQWNAANTTNKLYGATVTITTSI